MQSTTPGLIDIKNLRLGRLMSKLDYYQDNLKISAALLHENRFSKNPGFGLVWFGLVWLGWGGFLRGDYLRVSK
jgi:hypothetical protein